MAPSIPFFAQGANSTKQIRDRKILPHQYWQPTYKKSIQIKWGRVLSKCTRYYLQKNTIMPLNSKLFVRNQHLKQYQKGHCFVFKSRISSKEHNPHYLLCNTPQRTNYTHKLADEHSWNQISKFRTHEKKRFDFQFCTS